jgi:metal-responsive CopG/Arc/MetJ family transcriptional regulator
MVATKVTLTMPDDLLAAVDSYVKAHPEQTRSGVCAEALRAWLQAEQEAEIEAYYTERSEAEEAEDRAWNAIAAESAASLWP